MSYAQAHSPAEYYTALMQGFSITNQYSPAAQGLVNSYKPGWAGPAQEQLSQVSSAVVSDLERTVCARENPDYRCSNDTHCGTGTSCPRCVNHRCVSGASSRPHAVQHLRTYRR